MYRVVKQNKYNARSTLYDGIYYHSIKEAQFAQELDLRVKAKDIVSWERQIKIDLKVNGHHIANYYVDFLVYHNDGSKEFIEVKGFMTEIFRLKLKLFEATYLEEHPEVSYTIVR